MKTPVVVMAALSVLSAPACAATAQAQSQNQAGPPAQVEAQVRAEATADDGPMEVFRPTDAQMTCRQMADEAAALSDLMSDQSQTGPLGRMTGVARAGAGMLIPGVGLLASAVDALTAGQREKREAQRMAVRDRWHYLNGLYAGRRCA